MLGYLKRKMVSKHHIGVDFWNQSLHKSRPQHCWTTKERGGCDVHTYMWCWRRRPCIIFLDFPPYSIGRTESEDHARLLSRLKHYGVAGEMLAWLENFLTAERFARVESSAAESSVSRDARGGERVGAEEGPPTDAFHNACMRGAPSRKNAYAAHQQRVHCAVNLRMTF